jgi:hypothetical protein
MRATGRSVVRLMGVRIGAALLAAMAASASLGAGPARAGAAVAAPGWAVKVVAMPTEFSSQDNGECESEERCDRYAITVTNVGAVASSGPVVVTDTLPSGNVEFHAYRARDLTSGQAISCAQAGALVECADNEAVQPDASILLEVWVLTEAGPEAPLEDRAEARGGGAASAVTTFAHNVANAAALPAFDLTDFSFDAYGIDGQPEGQAGAHPHTLSTSFDFANALLPGFGATSFLAIEEPKDVTLELPLGLVGDPQATALTCPEADLATKPEVVSPGFTSACPPASRIGTVVLNRQFGFESSQSTESVSALYNMTPENGYPAVFGFRFISAPVLLYARVVPTPDGYRIRMTAPDLPHAPSSFKIVGATLSFFGAPNVSNELTGESPLALFRNPTSCSGDPQSLAARIEANSWVKPQRVVSAEAPAYAQIEGCNLLQLDDPSLEVQPEKTVADTPSGYEITLKAPQSDLFEQRAVPDVKRATVTLPAGVSLSPSGANGLQACSEAQIDPLGTELGEGHPGGNDSPYDDGLDHAAPGHCPDASKVGQVEVKTPLLSEPLKGAVYVAQPSCGGEGQPQCTEQGATNGQLYGLYVEVSGSGVILKLRAKIAADPRTGQLTVSFSENPQLPFEELKVKLDGGHRAPLASPQTCGPALASSELEPQSAPFSGPNATPGASFATTGCQSPMPFAPSLDAGSTVVQAGAFTPFTFTLTRTDGQQDFGAVSATLPPGLLAMAADVERCGEPQADEGSCPEASRIGTVRVASGAGSEPLWLEGPVYFTGPYGGAPFGLSIVVPAEAGPFDLGDEVVRAAVSIEPHTAQVTTTAQAVHLIRDGIPFRLKTIAVTIDRPRFMFNPTGCGQRRVSAVVSGDLPDGSPGSTASLSSPFGLEGCASLPFKPVFSISTQAKHSKQGGTGIHVTVLTAAGETGIASVHVEVPRILPSRLTTLNHACTEAQFAANPAGCPPGSFVGTATAQSPILAVPLMGPAIFVSHGGKAFPNLDLVLQGEGVTIVLVGDTFIDKSGVTSSTFASVPDVPVRRFDVDLPAGPNSALSASGDLCASPLFMPTTMTAQDGASVHHKTRVAVSGCNPLIGVIGHSVRRHVATIVTRVPFAGVLKASASGLFGAVKRAPKAGIVTVRLRITPATRRFLARHPGRRLKASVRLRFRRPHATPLFTDVTVLVR